MRLPDFLGIGPPKAGSTWLWAMLRQHPTIFLPEKKEMQYFNPEAPENPTLANPNYTKSLRWYAQHFSSATDNQLLGEISPVYLSSAHAAENIKILLPGVRLISILRDPVIRTYSNYRYRIQRGAIRPMPFQKALEVDPTLLHYSRYGSQLQSYLRLFDSSQVFVTTFDDVVNHPEELLRSLCGFLGVDPWKFDAVHEKVNETQHPKYPTAARLITHAEFALRKARQTWVIDISRRVGLGRAVRLVRSASSKSGRQIPELTEDDENRLRSILEGEMRLVEDLTGIDTTAWLPK